MKFQRYTIVLFSIVLASCTTVVIAPTPTNVSVATIAVTKTAILRSATFAPTITVTPKPSAATTSTPFSSEPYSDALFTQKLNLLVLRPTDIPRIDLSMPDVMHPDYPQLIQPKVQDSTNEIENCGKDCVSVIWKSKEVEGVGKREVSITLIRMESDLQAAESVVASWREFSQVASGTGFEQGALIQSDSLPSNSKVGIRYKEPDVEVMLTGSRGPIYMKFVYHFQASGDLVVDFGGIQHLAMLQVKKLEAAGYPK